MVQLLKEKFFSIYFCFGHKKPWTRQNLLLGSLRSHLPCQSKDFSFFLPRTVLGTVKFVINSLLNHVKPHLNLKSRKTYLGLGVDAVTKRDKMCLPVGSSECIFSCNWIVLQRHTWGRAHMCNYMCSCTRAQENNTSNIVDYCIICLAALNSLKNIFPNRDLLYIVWIEPRSPLP